MPQAQSQGERFDRLAETLLREAGRSTIVAVVEDAHWADAASLEFLAYLAARIESARVLLVVSYRSEALQPDHPNEAGIARLTRAARSGRIELRPLDGPSMRRFIDEALGRQALPSETLRAIARASEGNPLFIEELLKNAVERGVAAAPARVSLPASVRAALVERLRPLEPEAKRVIAHASVIGRSFDLDLLARTLGAERDALLPALRRACDLQLLEEETPERFRFRHALTREAIYGRFLGAEARQRHRAIALAIESDPPERQSVERLAYHWNAAGDERARRRVWRARGRRSRARVRQQRCDRRLRTRAGRDRCRIARCARASSRSCAKRRVMMGYNERAHAAYIEAAEIFRDATMPRRRRECRFRAAVQAYRLGVAEPAADLERMLERLGDGEPAARG